MRYNLLFSLVGMVLEIMGAFILSADAIGLDKFINWASLLLDIKTQLTEEKQKKDSILKPSKGRIVFAIISSLGSGCGLLFGRHFFKQNQFGVAISSFFAAFAGIAILFITIFLLKGTATALKIIEIRSRKKTIGVIGFLFLLAGFILQFTGTLFDYMK